jgi:hypothetical protein
MVVDDAMQQCLRVARTIGLIGGNLTALTGSEAHQQALTAFVAGPLADLATWLQQGGHDGDYGPGSRPRVADVAAAQPIVRARRTRKAT